MDSDLELLRRYEPVVHYTQGELFLPLRSGDYLAGAALYAATRDRDEPRLIAAPGTLDPRTLARLGREHDEEPLYLQYVSSPLSRSEFKEWRKDPDRPRFTASSRFASVGLLSRLIDTTMRLTLLLRGRVPGGYAAAAHRQVGDQSVFAYYGHVTRDAGYVVLQYWYLYAMNDWRSTFGGVNDHEADWEQVTIFLLDRGPDADPEPAWVAFSSHDEVGDDLRRRWDDPDITFAEGTHPVVYAGAGSHSGADLPGEYVISVGLPLPSFVDRLRRGLTRVLPWSDSDSGDIGIPYIDYRRGDGVAIGPGQERAWTPVLIDDDTDWVVGYRGLWGLDTRDPLGGERGPAGPRYDRDGSVRESWRQPVAWAGLDKEAPTEAEATQELDELGTELRHQRKELQTELDRTRRRLRGARYADRVGGHDPRHPTAAVRRLGREVADLRSRDAELAEQLGGVERARSRAAVAEPVHAHLRHRAVPLAHAGAAGLRQRLLRIWAAASASLLLGAAGVLMLLGVPNVVGALLVLVLVMVVIEAALRGRLVQLLLNGLVLVVLLATVWAVVSVIVGNFRQGVGVLLLLAAGYMGWQTFREGART
ncbi:MAG: hypothetical protein R2737_14095 [Candidatus Nanopelagicales bacterium]